MVLSPNQNQKIINPIEQSPTVTQELSEKFYNATVTDLQMFHEELFVIGVKPDFEFDLFILVKYNYKKTYKNRGSAIFLHLTKNYSPTKGCIAVQKK